MQDVTAGSSEIKTFLGKSYMTCPHCGGIGKSGKTDSGSGCELPCRTCAGWGTVDERRFPEGFEK